MKQREIKDYLHLYKGVECEFGYEGRKKIGTLEGVHHPFGAQVFDPSFIGEGYRAVNPDLIKLLLRPLSDMTEAESLELIRVRHPENTHPIIANVVNQEFYLLFNAKDERMKYYVNFGIAWDQLHSDEFLWLLSKGFDLFGLIDEGLAIDKTKL